MIIIDLSKERNLESALRTYKSKVQKTKQVQLFGKEFVELVLVGDTFDDAFHELNFNDMMKNNK